MSETASNASDFSNTLASALTMAKRGFKVFPVKPNSKDPFSKDAGDDPVLCGGINTATTNAARIESWFAHNPGMNYGMPTERHAVLDIDVRKNPTGWYDEYDGLGPIPWTLIVSTPSSGQHIWFSGFEAGQRKLAGATCIDVRGKGGYVVGPGSVVNGRAYTIVTDAKPAPIPEAIKARMSKPGERVADATAPVADLDTPAALTWGEAFAGEASGAVQGDRNARLFLLTCQLKDKGIARETAHQLLTEHWCPRCDPPYEDWGEIEGTVDSAYINGLLRPGHDSPELAFEDLTDNLCVQLADIQRAERAAKAALPESLTGLLADGATPPGAPTVRPRSYWIQDEPLNTTVDWLVDEMLPKGGIGFLAAASGEGKTFLLFHFMLCIARGVPFFGRDIAAVGGTYLVCGEGGYSARQRVTAAVRQKFGEGIEPIVYEKAASNLRNPKEFADFVQAVRGANVEMRRRYKMPIRLIGFDTYQKCLSGKDDNDANSAGEGIKIMQRLADVLGVAVLSTHHFGKDAERGIRGSSAFKADVDLVLTIPKRGRLVLDKVRDGEDGKGLGAFTLDKAILGKNKKGRDITSLYVTEGGAGGEFEVIEDDDTAKGVLMRAARSAIDVGSPEMRQHPETGEMVWTVPLGSARKLFMDNWRGNQEGKRRAFHDARKALAKVQPCPIFKLGEAGVETEYVYDPQRGKADDADDGQ